MFYCFMYDFFVALIFALALLKYASLRLPTRCKYLRNAYYVITFCCFIHVFVDSACKQLTMALSQARNLFRPNNWLGDLTGGYVNNFICFFE